MLKECVMVFRRFLHTFGIHYWGPWSLPVLTDAGFYGIMNITQDRYCLICWKYDNKKVGQEYK